MSLSLLSFGHLLLGMQSTLKSSLFPGEKSLYFNKYFGESHAVSL